MSDKTNDLAKNFNIYKLRIPKNCIPIGDDDSGNLICLWLNSGIFFWDHEEEDIFPKNMYKISETFMDFLKMIKKNESNNVVLDNKQIISSWIDLDFPNEQKD